LVGATVDQIRLRFGLGRTQAYRRLQVLHAYGLVKRHRLLAERPTLYAARGQRVRIATFEHALAVTELVVARELAGARILTDTELHRARGEQRRLGLLPVDGGLALALECERIPDAAEVRRSGELWAYELERSSKGRRRREAILTDYAASSYQKVIWIAPDRQLAAPQPPQDVCLVARRRGSGPGVRDVADRAPEVGVHPRRLHRCREPKARGERAARRSPAARRNGTKRHKRGFGGPERGGPGRGPGP
jgi:hypothetical protein